MQARTQLLLLWPIAADFWTYGVAARTDTMSDPIAGGNLFAIPFDPMRGDPVRMSRLLDHMAEKL